MTPVQVEPFRDSCRACKLLFCNFQDDCYKGLEETVQLGSDSCWAKSFWECSWEPLILWRDSSKRQHWCWDACPDDKLYRNFCTADKLCPGSYEVYTLCNNTCRLSEIPLGAAATGIQYSQGLSPLLPPPKVGTWFDSELFEELLALSYPLCSPRYAFLTSRGKQEGSRIRGLKNMWHMMKTLQRIYPVI